MHDKEKNLSAMSKTPNNKIWWQKLEIQVAIITGIFLLLSVLLPALLSNKSTSSSANTDARIGNVEGDVIIQNQNDTKTGRKERSSEQFATLNPTNTNQNKKLHLDMTPLAIMEALYAHDNDSDRRYAALEFEDVQIPSAGWEAVVTRRSEPSSLGRRHVIFADSDGVKLLVFSNESLRHLAINDKINITGSITIDADYGRLDQDAIVIRIEKISRIGRGDLPLVE